MNESEDQSDDGRDDHGEFIDWDEARLEHEFACWVNGVSQD